MGHYSEEILRNAETINRLKKRIDETVKNRDKNDHKRKEWEKAWLAGLLSFLTIGLGHIYNEKN